MPQWFVDRYFVGVELGFNGVYHKHPLKSTDDPGYHISAEGQHILAEGYYRLIKGN
jgi:hypothetical protein